MNPQVAWYAARAAGIMAWLLLTVSVLWGLLLSTRVLGGHPTQRWLLDLHRFLGGLAVTFTAVHVASLVADTYVDFGAVDTLIPFASEWRPGAVALGVVGMWLLVAVELTSLLMRRLPRRAWRAVHLLSYGVFWMATLHGLAAGADARNPVFVLTSNLAVAAVVFLTLVSIFAGRGHIRPRSRSIETPA